MNTALQPDLFEPPVPASARHDLVADEFCARVAPEQRREEGITFTPPWLVERMIEQAGASADFDTVIDPGAGSGRFTLAAARRFARARVLAVERNPELAESLRHRVREEGLGARVTVIEGDFRSVAIDVAGRALYIGNPPYVRHHDIEPQCKEWYAEAMAARGVRASRLAGLHAHFLLRIAQLLRPGDAWCLVTAAEWLDNGYGSAIRELLAQPGAMGLRSVWLAAADEPVFADALVSAVVVEGQAGVLAPTIAMGQVRSQTFVTTRSLAGGAGIASQRWSALCQPGALTAIDGIELGELFRITRGQVTGMNRAWLLPEQAPSAWRALSVAAVTRAREIIDGTVTSSDAASRLKRVIDLPVDPESLPPELREAALAIMERARRMGAERGYIARQRRRWFAVGMRAPPLAFVSYMGRRPPVFRSNPQRVSYLNIAHGLYPRCVLADGDLERLLAYLNTTTDLYAGRVYGGGLAKFEPSDVARLRLPASVWEARS